ncbi:MAG: hypothetical protein QNK03_07930, partial [Myxococcota bacterium]|nr:hypothetical protein [Myxococcota bacterium]
MRADPFEQLWVDRGPDRGIGLGAFAGGEVGQDGTGLVDFARLRLAARFGFASACGVSMDFARLRLAARFGFASACGVLMDFARLRLAARFGFASACGRGLLWFFVGG